jgi:hypothetical protein
MMYFRNGIYRSCISTSFIRIKICEASVLAYSRSPCHIELKKVMVDKMSPKTWRLLRGRDNTVAELNTSFESKAYKYFQER